MKKIIYLIAVLSIVLVGCAEPCNPNTSKVSYLKIGLEDKEGIIYMQIEGSSSFGLIYGDLVQYECNNRKDPYNVLARDVSHYSTISEDEYNKNNGLTNQETVTLDTTLTY